jgi:hypothetical protein
MTDYRDVGRKGAFIKIRFPPSPIDRVSSSLPGGTNEPANTFFEFLEVLEAGG